MRSAETGMGIGDIASSERRCRPKSELSATLGTEVGETAGRGPSAGPARLGGCSSTGVMTVMAVSSSSSSAPLRKHAVSGCTRHVRPSSRLTGQSPLRTLPALWYTWAAYGSNLGCYSAASVPFEDPAPSQHSVNWLQEFR